MNYKKTNIKEGITLHTIDTKKFKTNLLTVFLTTPLSRKNVTKQALIASVLRRGTNKMKTTEEISIKLEEMYGASFNCGIEKIGNNHIIKFYLETINDEFLPQKEEILQNGLETLFELVFDPYIENGKFKEEYVKTEKENLKQIIEGKKDNKAKYALERCTQEMYKDEPYGLYKFGYIEDLEEITPKNLYDYYKEMINTAKIDIFVSGKIDNKEIEKTIQNMELIKMLPKRANAIAKDGNLPKRNVPQIIKEKMDITQGKLVIGLTLQKLSLEEKYIVLVYNTILGGGPTSKLFQNVREKASLAYTASSNYVRQMNNIFIRCGIEIKNYEKATQIIKEQIKDIENGKFTDKDLQNAKQSLISAIKFIPDEQDTQITYYFGGEIAGNYVPLEEYTKKIEAVTKEEVLEISKKVNVHTVYFLTNE